MSDDVPILHRPWLVAVWPGMGHVAGAAGHYLTASLGMEELAEFHVPDVFDLDQVEVENGLIQPGRLPRNRVFVWRDPEAQRDLLVFVGEAQPRIRKYAFCRELIRYAEQLGVERVFTFAAMATSTATTGAMLPVRDPRVVGAATDPAGLDALERAGLEALDEGHIGGLNGVLLGAAAERGLPGMCLLGEIPHLYAQMPFPRASVAVLQAFAAIAGLELSLDDLRAQADEVEKQIGRLLSNMQEQFGAGLPGPAPAPQRSIGFDLEEADAAAAADADAAQEPDALAPVDHARIERLFDESEQDRSRADELKRTLDRLGLFDEYEDRFLDLFRPAD